MPSPALSRPWGCCQSSWEGRRGWTEKACSHRGRVESCTRCGRRSLRPRGTLEPPQGPRGPFWSRALIGGHESSCRALCAVSVPKCSAHGISVRVGSAAGLLTSSPGSQTGWCAPVLTLGRFGSHGVGDQAEVEGRGRGKGWNSPSAGCRAPSSLSDPRIHILLLPGSESCLQPRARGRGGWGGTSGAAAGRAVTLCGQFLRPEVCFTPCCVPEETPRGDKPGRPWSRRGTQDMSGRGLVGLRWAQLG